MPIIPRIEIPVTLGVTTTKVSGEVNAEYGSAGEALDYTAESQHVTLSNPYGISTVELKIDNGEWLDLPPQSTREVDIDFSAQTMYLRRGKFETLPILVFFVIQSPPEPLGEEEIGARSYLII